MCVLRFSMFLFLLDVCYCFSSLLFKLLAFLLMRK